MEGLSTYYNLSECSEREIVINYLNKLVQESKIEWNNEDIDIIKVIDIDLDEAELDSILDFFYKYDVISDVYKSSDDDYYDPLDMYDEDDYNDYDDFGFGDNL